MFCTNCGNKIKEGEKFCTGCGNSISFKLEENNNHQIKISNDEKWWHRLIKVLYLIAYLPLLGIIPLVWSENTPYCYTPSGRLFNEQICYGSYWESFWYSLLTLVIYVIILRLIKLAVVYVIFGQKPKWKKEFKKLY